MPRCADTACARWRPGPPAPRWMAGLRLNDAWYCSRTCLESAVRDGLQTLVTMPHSVVGLPPLKLGALLRHQGAINETQLRSALDAQRTTGLRLGAQLEQLGWLATEPLLRALAAQAGISYLTTLDLSRVKQAPGDLTETTVRALGLIPFEADEDRARLHVLCTAPVPRASLRALSRLTTWTPEPYLVDDRLWERALAAYRPADTPVPHDALLVGDFRTAATRVAQVARQSGAVTMKQADCRDYVWVRVEGSSHVHDVLVTTSEEKTCQAASTVL